jgi:polyphosphate kinase 2 (PPK2 family)
MAVPERGRIGIFNRSYYEDVLVVRVHPELLQAQKLPPSCRGKNVFDERYRQIRDFERYLASNGVAICKFFLHVSKDEQKKRFLERLDRPEKNWKFSANDARERTYWKDYMRAYEDAIQPATPSAVACRAGGPQVVHTAVVAATVVDALSGLDLKFPTVDLAKRREGDAVRRTLKRERA